MAQAVPTRRRFLVVKLALGLGLPALLVAGLAVPVREARRAAWRAQDT